MIIVEYLKLIRINHWIKNVFVFVPLLFSKNLLNLNYSNKVLIAFFVFGFASSAIYVFNDICDINYDRNHHTKKYRPLASGAISLNQAWIVISVLMILTVAGIYNFSNKFSAIILLFIILNILYSLLLKKIVIIDVFSITAGFLLRVLGGAVVINVEVSNWLILTTIFISLFLAIIKRKSELVTQNSNYNTRVVLEHYSKKHIDQISVITASGVIICYSLYSVSTKVVSSFHSDYFVYTTIFVIYGIFRYLFLSQRDKTGEDVAEIILKDFPSIINIILFFTSIIYIIYY